ncbi:MAG: cell division protein ZapA [Oscillospiraceae bacterium]|jgi:cell division protein ZapA|nr:cell division protein ZapA [Oscillospiraceae bacterium]
MEKIKTTVRIGGRDYTMVGVDSEEHIRRVAIYVDRRMEELSLATRLPQPMAAVLTAMNIADDLIKAQDENTRLRKELLQGLHAPSEKAAQ